MKWLRRYYIYPHLQIAINTLSVRTKIRVVAHCGAVEGTTVIFQPGRCLRKLLDDEVYI